MREFRKLEAGEIEVRVGRFTNEGAVLLLYKDARADMRILDEQVGPMRWQRSHQVIDGNLYCTVSIYDEELGEWVSKQDVGTESNIDREKGQASDSFKRACTNWGIGRELYTAPVIYIKGQKDDLQYARWKVTKIAYDAAGRISVLHIEDKKGNEVFGFDEAVKTETISANEVAVLRNLCEKWGKTLEEIFNVPVETLTRAQYAEAVRRLK